MKFIEKLLSKNLYNNEKKTAVSIGALGEEAAALALKKKGYKIIERNYRSKMGEIDIIAKDDHTLVFVEVKARSTTNYGHPFESINSKKMQNIFKAGLAYLKNTKEKYKKYRIDIISVLGRENPQIEHLKDVSLN